MEYVSLIMQEHLAHDCIERLGEIGVAQFTDMNGDLTAFKRFYTPFIRRCDELEKKLKFFEDEMIKHGVVRVPPPRRGRRPSRPSARAPRGPTRAPAGPREVHRHGILDVGAQPARGARP